jgi:L-alanine-DL-glutamate epimerase-like enolase superfamily enzyme
MATAILIDKTLKQLVIGEDAMHIPALTEKMKRCIRNNDNCGIAMMAVSAVDTALWDLKAKILNVSLGNLIGSVKKELLVYGSGGFTSYTTDQLVKQLGQWVDMGISHVKIKIGAHLHDDEERVRIARETIGKKTKLFLDANGAYSARQAIGMARKFEPYEIFWLEEPVSSDDLKGLHFIRQNAPPSIRIAAGEYGCNLPYFQTMLEAGAVDVLQADATRCGGISNFVKAGHVSEAYQVPFSSHCAPAIHLHAALALPSFFIAEYFYDHYRIEDLLFDGTIKPKNGYLIPDFTRPGLGIMFKHQDAAHYKVA